MMKYDKHHLLYPKHDWNKNAARRLRTHWYLVVNIPKNTLHVQIHKDVGFVPVPSENIIREVLVQIHLMETYGAIHIDDPVAARLGLLISLFDSMSPKTTDALNGQLNVVCNYQKAFGR